MSRAACLVLIAAFVAPLTVTAVPVWADEAISTAKAVTPPAAAAGSAAPTEIQGQASLTEIVKSNPCLPGPRPSQETTRVEGDGVTQKVEPDYSPHGEIDAGVGSRGYRSVHAAVCQPIGEHSFVAVDVGTGSYGRR
jgi:hypothetical protein